MTQGAYTPWDVQNSTFIHLDLRRQRAQCQLNFGYGHSAYFTCIGLTCIGPQGFAACSIGCSGPLLLSLCSTQVAYEALVRLSRRREGLTRARPARTKEPAGGGLAWLACSPHVWPYCWRGCDYSCRWWVEPAPLRRGVLSPSRVHASVLLRPASGWGFPQM